MACIRKQHRRKHLQHFGDARNAIIISEREGNGGIFNGKVDERFRTDKQKFRTYHS